jgi:hypothetical protein
MTGNDSEATARLTALVMQLPLSIDPDIERRGKWFSGAFQLKIGEVAFLVTVADGKVASVERGPYFLRTNQFSIAATEEAWSKFWQPIPEPGWHDIFALAKRGAATIEGNLQPLMANLQYVKDVLAAPRQRMAQTIAGAPR